MRQNFLEPCRVRIRSNFVLRFTHLCFLEPCSKPTINGFISSLTVLVGKPAPYQVHFKIDSISKHYPDTRGRVYNGLNPSVEIAGAFCLSRRIMEPLKITF
jgi:hypothetical protein